MRNLFTLLLITTCLAVPEARAQDLYTGLVPVQGQGETERVNAIPEALIQVLKKQSGLRDLPLDPALEQAVQDARRLLLSLQYREAERQRPDGTPEQRLLLAATFVPEAVDSLVREFRLPRWRLERQPVVLWVIVDDGNSRELMPVEYQYAFDRMQDIAAQRGLPIAWPGLSEELKAQVDLQLLWGGFTEQLMTPESASGGVAIVAARREGPDWNVRWVFADGQASSDWRTRDREISFALAAGMHQLTDLVASVNSIGPAGLGEWQVELLVAGLGSGQDYARALVYFEALSLVDAVQVKQAGPQGVLFVLDLNAEPGYLQRAIFRDGVLAAGEVENVYRLLP